MKTRSLLMIGVAGVLAYLFLMRKKATASASLSDRPSDNISDVPKIRETTSEFSGFIY